MPIRTGVSLRLGILAFGGITVEAAVDKDNGWGGRSHKYCTDGHAPARVQQLMRCTTNAEHISSADTPREWDAGIELEDGTVKLLDELTEEERKALTAGDKKVADNVLELTPHPAEQVLAATVQGDTVYYLSPGPVTPELYVLLRKIVESHPELMFLCQFRARTNSRPRIWHLTVLDGVLVIQSRAFPESLRAAPRVPEVEAPAYATPETIEALVTSLLQDFELANYEDRVKAAREALVASAGGTAPAGQIATVTDLFEALKASVKEAKAAKKAPAAKKAAAAKVPAQRGTATTKAAAKAPAKKAAATRGKTRAS